ncbi:hypothetical protein EDEG_01424 [Edhazardia aedis USNM 41457]|uniref:C2H2-type domain-containing protein n=1 Tax=Edhazardia aedis (strain USNM 41457) TaxID=1003232 RepID=J9DP25_EDHAE|nr:hypothetical protein EDEG_01424 [Edhazardia aedis USNM 41457]|eukprot:EJW04300.1 hypothetical protein EDEG_01424 [Edhazardia aedis USNM 41457]
MNICNSKGFCLSSISSKLADISDVSVYGNENNVDINSSVRNLKSMNSTGNFDKKEISYCDVVDIQNEKNLHCLCEPKDSGNNLSCDCINMKTEHSQITSIKNLNVFTNEDINKKTNIQQENVSFDDKTERENFKKKILENIIDAQEDKKKNHISNFSPKSKILSGDGSMNIESTSDGKKIDENIYSKKLNDPFPHDCIEIKNSSILSQNYFKKNGDNYKHFNENLVWPTCENNEYYIKKGKNFEKKINNCNLKEFKRFHTSFEDLSTLSMNKNCDIRKRGNLDNYIISDDCDRNLYNEDLMWENLLKSHDKTFQNKKNLNLSRVKKHLDEKFYGYNMIKNSSTDLNHASEKAIKKSDCESRDKLYKKQSYIDKNIEDVNFVDYNTRKTILDKPRNNESSVYNSLKNTNSIIFNDQQIRIPNFGLYKRKQYMEDGISFIKSKSNEDTIDSNITVNFKKHSFDKLSEEKNNDMSNAFVFVHKNYPGSYKDLITSENKQSNNEDVVVNKKIDNHSDLDHEYGITCEKGNVFKDKNYGNSKLPIENEVEEIQSVILNHKLSPNNYILREQDYFAEIDDQRCDTFNQENLKISTNDKIKYNDINFVNSNVCKKRDANMSQLDQIQEKYVNFNKNKKLSFNTDELAKKSPYNIRIKLQKSLSADQGSFGKESEPIENKILEKVCNNSKRKIITCLEQNLKMFVNEDRKDEKSTALTDDGSFRGKSDNFCVTLQKKEDFFGLHKYDQDKCSLNLESFSNSEYPLVIKNSRSFMTNEEENIIKNIETSKNNQNDADERINAGCNFKNVEYLPANQFKHISNSFIPSDLSQNELGLDSDQNNFVCSLKRKNKYLNDSQNDEYSNIQVKTIKDEYLTCKDHNINHNMNHEIKVEIEKAGIKNDKNDREQKKMKLIESNSPFSYREIIMDPNYTEKKEFSSSEIEKMEEKLLKNTADTKLKLKKSPHKEIQMKTNISTFKKFNTKIEDPDNVKTISVQKGNICKYESSLGGSIFPTSLDVEKSLIKNEADSKFEINTDKTNLSKSLIQTSIHENKLDMKSNKKKCYEKEDEGEVSGLEMKNPTSNILHDLENRNTGKSKNNSSGFYKLDCLKDSPSAYSEACETFSKSRYAINLNNRHNENINNIDDLEVQRYKSARGHNYYGDSAHFHEKKLVENSFSGRNTRVTNDFYHPFEKEKNISIENLYGNTDFVDFKKIHTDHYYKNNENYPQNKLKYNAHFDTSENCNSTSFNQEKETRNYKSHQYTPSTAMQSSIRPNTTQNNLKSRQYSESDNIADTQLFLYFVRSLYSKQPIDDLNRSSSYNNDIHYENNLSEYHVCQFCQMKYIYPRCLRNHIRKKHPNMHK